MNRSSSSQSLLREGKQTLMLAVPLIVGQVSQMLMGVVDTLMIGRVGVTELAASAFSNNLIYVPMMFGIGMSIVVSIRVSQARGKGDPAAARAALRHGLQISAVLGLLTLLGAWLLLPHLWIFRQVPEVLDVCPNYFLLVAGSMVPAMMAMAVKNHADAMNRPWPVFWITLGSVLLNAGLNWVFIFGKLGAPAMGLDGAGVATLLARTAGVVGLIWWSLKFSGLREWVPYHWFKSPDWKAVREFIRVGIPASMQLLAEVSAFVFAGIFIGTLGEDALAAHQVAISYAATVFMVPLGISMAMTVRVGEVSGSGERTRLRSIIASGWMIGVCFAILSVSVTLLFNDQIAGWFVEDPEVTKVAAGLLLIGAAFQFSDSFQVISVGSLRGLDDVKVPAWMAFCAYWLFAIPLGWTLAIPKGWGVNGMWWGLTLGLTLTAVALGVRVWRKTRI
ncbi:MATE family efflux transporter [Haloferula chungangensis]|uniref:Multidrug-efflux transporter n=1 Tax=Haloferula chungangensis TaxID=1048331 RepID=A0ABW2L9J5_9BACT